MDRKTLTGLVKSFLRHSGIRQNTLADDMKVNRTVLNEMINGKRDPTRLVEYLKAKYGLLLDIPDEDKLLTDVHPLDEVEAIPYTTSANGTRFYKEGDAMLMEVPKVERNALGSMDDEYAPNDADRGKGQFERFAVDGVHHGKYFAFEVDGDSMDNGREEGFRRGDIVLVRELAKDDWTPKLHISQWRFWVVVFGNCVRLKEIVAQTEDTITLHSLNPSPEYTDFTLRLDEVTHLYNVITKKPRQVVYGW